MPKSVESVSERFKHGRKVLKLTQKQLAKKLGVSTTSICEIEIEKRKPNCDILQNIAEVFNINLYWLLFGQGEMFLDPTILPMNKLRDVSIDPNTVQYFLRYFYSSPFIYHSVLSHFYSILGQYRESVDNELMYSKDRGPYGKDSPSTPDDFEDPDEPD